MDHAEPSDTTKRGPQNVMIDTASTGPSGTSGLRENNTGTTRELGPVTTTEATTEEVGFAGVDVLGDHGDLAEIPALGDDVVMTDVDGLDSAAAGLFPIAAESMVMSSSMLTATDAAVLLPGGNQDDGKSSSALPTSLLPEPEIDAQLASNISIANDSVTNDLLMGEPTLGILQDFEVSNGSDVAGLSDTNVPLTPHLFTMPMHSFSSSEEAKTDSSKARGEKNESKVRPELRRPVAHLNLSPRKEAVESSPLLNDQTAKTERNLDSPDDKLPGDSSQPESPVADDSEMQTPDHQSKRNIANSDSENAKQRSVLVDTYMPFIEPNDTSLQDARERLQAALEQTRLLRNAYTERVYEKYRVVLKPVPKSVDDIIGSIKSDPKLAAAALRERSNSIKIEKDRERKEALQAGIGKTPSKDGDLDMGPPGSGGFDPTDQYSFFGSGLSLVVLPEDDNKGNNTVNLAKYPLEGPLDLDDGQRQLGISAAAAAAAEVVFERVRRNNAIRNERDRQTKFGGGDVAMAVNNSVKDAAALTKAGADDEEHEKKVDIESCAIIDLVKTPRSSPAPSVDSNITTSRPKPASKQVIQSLLALSPEAEGSRVNGELTAVQSALIACGVGKDDSEEDNRVKLPHRRILKPESIDDFRSSLLTSSTNKFLPPLLGPRQIARKQPLKVYEPGSEMGIEPRRAIFSVVKGICVSRKAESSSLPLEKTDGEGGSLSETDYEKDIGTPLIDSSCEHSTTEIGYWHRMQLEEIESRNNRLKLSVSAGSQHELSDVGFDPNLTLSVMSAVGLVLQQSETHSSHRKVTHDDRDDSKIGANGLGLGHLLELESVSSFFRNTASKKRRFIDTISDTASSEISDGAVLSGITPGAYGHDHNLSKMANRKFYKNTEDTEEDEVVYIRGGGGDEEETDEDSQKEKNAVDGGNQNGGQNESSVPSKRGRVSGAKKQTSHNSPAENQSSPIPVFQPPTDSSANPIYNSQSQAPLGNRQNPFNLSNKTEGQAVAAAAAFGAHLERNQISAASRQLLQQHLGINRDPYRTAAIAHQLGVPMGSLPPNNFNQSQINALSTPELADYYIRSRLGVTPDWASLEAANLTNADILSRHPRLAAALGIGQMNISLRDQEAARAILMREQHNAAAARAQEAAAAARYQAALSSMNHQQNFGYIGQQIPQNGNAFPENSLPSSTSQVNSNVGRSADANFLVAQAAASRPKQLKGKQQTNPPGSLPLQPETTHQTQHRGKFQRKRSSSLSVPNQKENTAKKPMLVKQVGSTNGTGGVSSEPIMQRNSSRKSCDVDNAEGSACGSSIDALQRPASAPSHLLVFDCPNSSHPENSSAVNDISVAASEITSVAADSRKFKETNDGNDNSNVRISPAQSQPPNPAYPGKVSKKKIASSKSNHMNKAVSKQKSKSTLVDKSRNRLKFNVPQPPPGLPNEISRLISEAKFHEALSVFHEKASESDNLLIQFLHLASEAVPIPKSLVHGTLLEKFDAPLPKTEILSFIGNDSAASSARDVISAVILVWLWVEHGECFQHAFLKEGRMDTDLDCKWIISAAVDNAFFAISSFLKSYPSTTSTHPTATLNAQVAAAVSRSLLRKVTIDNEMNESLPVIDNLCTLLDSLRMEALQAKVRERVLLAALVSRCGNMSESFSNAYVSSLLRAGEAIGHEDVCEIAQDEECRASTMLPFDFFHDSTGIWEEPCRPPLGYHQDVTGDELKRRAHARSVIQKTLKRMQSRLGLKGGNSDGGPYFPSSPMSTSTLSPVSAGTPTAAPIARAPSSSLKRKGSQVLEPPPIPGAGGTSIPDSVFNPGHLSLPFIWDSHDPSNQPYGRHRLDCGSSGFSDEGASGSARSLGENNLNGIPNGRFFLRHRSTNEIEWENVANMFLHGGRTRYYVGRQKNFGNDRLIEKKDMIFAPFVQKIDCSSIIEEKSDETDESSDDEDISDEAILIRHQEVLDGMKKKLDEALQKRQQPQIQQRVRKK